MYKPFRLNSYENSIIVLYSNHGDGLYDNKVPNHGVSYQSCVSVPVLIKHPKVDKFIAVKPTVALIDLIPNNLRYAFVIASSCYGWS